MAERIPRQKIMERLATVHAIAGSLKLDLEDDLTAEDIAAGAEPLSPKQIQDELERICQLLTLVALHDLRAEPEEWYSITSKVE